MFDLANFTLRDITELGSVLRKAGDGARSMEEVANRVVRRLYNDLGDPETGHGIDPQAVVRIARQLARVSGVGVELARPASP